MSPSSVSDERDTRNEAAELLRREIMGGHASPEPWQERALAALDDLLEEHRLDRNRERGPNNAVPTIRELQDVIADHCRNAEPFANTRGIADAVYTFLTEREEAMQNETRPPHPGEYVDPQPAAVDVAGDEQNVVGRLDNADAALTNLADGLVLDVDIAFETFVDIARQAIDGARTAYLQADEDRHGGDDA